MTDPDRRPAGDPRDPRGDLRRSHRGRRRLPRLALALLAVLVAGFLLGLRRLVVQDPGAVLEALAFAAAVIVIAVGGLLWADRRWPQRPDGRK